jgi:sigma-B regulation protein RsbU (phosphoserine phosphatase)
VEAGIQAAVIARIPSMNDTATPKTTAESPENWRERLAIVVQTMREISRETDPQAMVRAYGTRVRQLRPVDGFVALSRRDLDPPWYRITRSSLWKEEINPWKQKHLLPVLQGGLLGELIYGDEPRIIDELDVKPDEPGAQHLTGYRSLVAIPNFDHGVALNMVISLRKEPHAFRREEFPEMVWLSNLFGRAAHNLVLAEQLREAYEAVDRELKMVASIQRSLLPSNLPQIPNMHLATHYQTARRAGGDYYDFFPLPDRKWAIMIADVSGHGTPAAVMMAITHSIAHSYPGPPAPAHKMLDFVNYHLATRYTSGMGSFVTAFYGVYDPSTRQITYSCAGHNPPRLKRCGGDGSILSLDGVTNLPLGISADESYQECTQTLEWGDQIVFYTDGITEAQNEAGEIFGLERLDRVLAKCRENASDLIAAVLASVEEFTAGQPPQDDRTLLVAKVS